MKKIIKKSFCILMAILMIACIVPFSAFAESGTNQTPVIFISGIGNTTLYANKGTDKQKSVFTPEWDWEDVINLAKGITKFEDNGNNYYGYMKTVFTPFLQKYIEAVRCDGNGNSVYPVQIDSTQDSYADSEIAREKGGIVSDVQLITTRIIGQENVFRLTYDYRLSTIEAAKSLRSLVEHVKEVRNAKKVRLVAVSMGGSVLTAYLNMYSHEDLDSVISVTSTIQGTNFPSTIFSGQLNLDRDTLAASLKNLVGIVPAAAIASLQTYIDDINKMWSGESLTYFYDNWIKPYIGKWAGLWCMIPSEKVDKCIDFMLDKDADAGLIQKIKTFQSYQDNMPNILKQLNKEGVNTYILSSYNINGLPFKGNDGQGDIIIDTKYESAGATVASFTEKTLGDNYKQKVDDGKNRLSVDGIIDASTCVLPDQTWFIKDMMHCMFVEKTDDGKKDQTGEFFKWIMSSKTQLTVESESKYPQFMLYTKSSGKLEPLVKITVDEAEKDNKGYISSALTTYTYTKLTALGWAVILLVAALVIILIAKKAGNKEKIEGVLTSKEIKALPKEERKPAKQNNKVLKKQYKKDKKAEVKAHKAELKAMPKDERKEAVKADKATKKENKKTAKAEKKSAKAEKKANKKSAKAEKKTAKASK